jgi:hypothetical protein
MGLLAALQPAAKLPAMMAAKVLVMKMWLKANLAKRIKSKK